MRISNARPAAVMTAEYRTRQVVYGGYTKVKSSFTCLREKYRETVKYRAKWSIPGLLSAADFIWFKTARRCPYWYGANLCDWKAASTPDMEGYDGLPDTGLPSGGAHSGAVAPLSNRRFWPKLVDCHLNRTEKLMANFIDNAVTKIEKTKPFTIADRDALVDSDENVIKLARSLLGTTACRNGETWAAPECTDNSNESIDTVNNW